MTEDGETYPPLPGVEVATQEQSFSYRGDVPVFYGHYSRRGRPQRRVDFTERTACVDFSALKTGASSPTDGTARAKSGKITTST
jgi:hypothetical protein